MIPGQIQMTMWLEELAIVDKDSDHIDWNVNSFVEPVKKTEIEES